jgi:predicted AAA+ superfamily ATPase
MYRYGMIKRAIQKELSVVSKEYAVVTISGPRQSGKTTLAKMQFPNHTYCNLEHPDTRRLAERDPNAFFEQFPAPMIIDEVQRVPELLSYIQIKADETSKRGQYILTGSHQLALHEAISQSLAGRTALLELLPLSIEELSAAGIERSRDEYIFQGFYPRIYAEMIDPQTLYRNYFRTYVERDVRQILNIKDLNLFEQFIHLLAGRTGQVINFHSIGNDLGVSGKTLKEWLSVLEASFVVFRLPSYFNNFGKRIVKSPKIYFTDTGFLCYLLGIEKPEQVMRDPAFGSLFENLVVIEALKAQTNQGKRPHLYFFRDNNRHEVDLVFNKGRKLFPIEIKASMTWNPDFLKGIHYFKRTVPYAEKGIVIYSGDLQPNLEAASVIHFKRTGEIFR